MKTKSLLIAIACLIGVSAIVASSNAAAATLKDKTIVYSSGYLAGQVIPLGVDPYGYNYQAHMFAGNYFNSYANAAGCAPYNNDGTPEYDSTYLANNPNAASHWAWPFRADQLAMKWNEAWLSNQDKDGDGKLDRHYGLPSYIGSGAWLNNHQSGTYDLSGEEINWNYFVKIVAVPADATATDGFWNDASGKEIGQSIWGEFATVEEVNNDRGAELHGNAYHSPAGPGVGKY